MDARTKEIKKEIAKSLIAVSLRLGKRVEAMTKATEHFVGDMACEASRHISIVNDVREALLDEADSLTGGNEDGKGKEG